MDRVPWLFEKLKRTSGARDFSERIVAGIKIGVLHGRLNQLHALVLGMNGKPSLVSEVLPPLNYVFRSAGLSFKWIPEPAAGSGSLLVRNNDIGLIVPAFSGAELKGMAMVHFCTAGKIAPPEFCPITAEDALAKLSTHVRMALGTRTVSCREAFTLGNSNAKTLHKVTPVYPA